MRELTVLGTASQVPTRLRNHNGYLLRWDDEVHPVRPGRGHPAAAAASPGSPPPTSPGSASPTSTATTASACPASCNGCRWTGCRTRWRCTSRPAGPTTSTGCGTPAASTRPPSWRSRRSPPTGSGSPGRRHAGGPPAAAPDRDVRVPVGRARRLPDAAGAAVRVRHRGAGGRGAAARRAPGRRRTPRHRDEVSVVRPGQRFAFVMDTGLCDGVYALAEDADLLVIESTFLASEADARRRGRPPDRRPGWPGSPPRRAYARWCSPTSPSGTPIPAASTTRPGSTSPGSW